MSDLIRRQDAIDVCDKYNGNGYVWTCIREGIRKLPVVDIDLSGYSDRLWKGAHERGKQDAMAKIVRCEECKHYIAHDKRCGYWNHGVSLDWWDEWCSHGERRGDGGSD